KGLVGPDVTTIEEKSGGWIEAIFEAYAGVSEPFPGRISASPAATKDIRREASGFKRPAGDEAANDLIDKVAAVRRNVDVGANANFPQEKIIQPDTATPSPMANIGFEQFVQSPLASDIAAEGVEGKLGRREPWPGRII